MDCRLTRNELAAAIRCARRYPAGHGYRWGWGGRWKTFTYDLLPLGCHDLPSREEASKYG